MCENRLHQVYLIWDCDEPCDTFSWSSEQPAAWRGTYWTESRRINNSDGSGNSDRPTTAIDLDAVWGRQAVSMRRRRSIAKLLLCQRLIEKHQQFPSSRGAGRQSLPLSRTLAGHLRQIAELSQVILIHVRNNSATSWRSFASSKQNASMLLLSSSLISSHCKLFYRTARRAFLERTRLKH